MSATVSLTHPQQRVLVYLYRSGWASEKQTARMMYGNPRQRSRAAGIIGRLARQGLAETYLVHDGRGRAWRLTEVGSALARRLLEDDRQ